MFSHDFFLSGRLSEALGWMVLHSLWQATLIGVIAGIVLSAMRRRPARVRYLLAYSALAMVLITTLVTLGYYLSDGAAPASGRAGSLGAGSAVQLAPPGSPSPTLPAVEITLQGHSAPLIHLQDWLPFIVLLWLVGMFVFLLRLTGNIGYAYYLKTRLNFPTETCWQDLLDSLAQKAGYRKVIRLAESALVRTPMLVGHLKPVVLFPIGMINRLDPEEAEAILAHELAHIIFCAMTFYSIFSRDWSRRCFITTRQFGGCRALSGTNGRLPPTTSPSGSQASPSPMPRHWCWFRTWRWVPPFFRRLLPERNKNTCSGGFNMY